MKVLLTGGGGFLGAWIIRRLAASGIDVRVFDTSENRSLVTQFAGISAHGLEWHVGDIVSTDQVASAAAGCDSIVHLAGVLTPFCREHPLRGAHINVIGTLNVFEAARKHGMKKVVYTSSGGVFGPDDVNVPFPTTHYGAYKLCNEGNARAYWEDAQIASIGFRPFVVYGPGREGGLSAGPTIACREAAWGRPYTIPISGKAGMVYVDDVAAAYERALDQAFDGAHTLNLTGVVADMDEIVANIRRIIPDAELGVTGPPLPTDPHVRNEWSSPLLNLPPERTLDQGICETVDHYRAARPT